MLDPISCESVLSDFLKATLKGIVYQAEFWKYSTIWGEFSTYPESCCFIIWTPRRKIHLMWTPEKEFICWNGFPMVNQGPRFYKYKSLAAICWPGLLTYSVHPWRNLRLQLPASPTIPFLFTLSAPNTAGKFCLSLSTNNWDLLRPVKTAQFGYLIYITQT